MSRKVYELEPRAFEFKFEGQDYVLREATEAAAARYKGARQKALRIANDKVSGFEASMMEANAVLVAGCCFRQTGKDETPVALHVVQGWPHRLTLELFDECKKLCPELEPKVGKTVKELEAEIADLKQQLADAKEGTSDPKGLPSSGEDTSS